MSLRRSFLSIPCRRAFIDNTQYFVNRNRVTFLLDNFLQDATLLGGYFHIYLIGLKFHKGIPLAHIITFVFEPAGNDSIND